MLLRCLPAENAFQHCVEERLTVSEAFTMKEGRDAFGNRILYGSAEECHKELQYSCSGTVEQTTYCIPDALPHPMYRMPSPLVDFSSSASDGIDGNKGYADGMEGIEGYADGVDNSGKGVGDFLEVCRSVMHEIHGMMTYRTGSTGMETKVSEVLRRREGVCQDFAHVMIAILRKRGIAARYVCGMMQGEGATHAWVEAHDGQCWYAFDPTNDTCISSGYVKLAHGRDAADCPVMRGTYVMPMGPVQERMSVEVKTLPLIPPPVEGGGSKNVLLNNY